MKDSTKRLLALAAMAAFGIGLIFFGFRGLMVDGLPAQYIGYFCLVIVAMGLFGANVWKGGPLDRNRSQSDQIEK